MSNCHVAGLLIMYSRILFNDLSLRIMWSWKLRCHRRLLNGCQLLFLIFWIYLFVVIVLNHWIISDIVGADLCVRPLWFIPWMLFDILFCPGSTHWFGQTHRSAPTTIFIIPWIWLGYKFTIFPMSFNIIFSSLIIPNNCCRFSTQIVRS